jgi:hypothetical protein
MSLFRVQLNNTMQGRLDQNVYTRAQVGYNAEGAGSYQSETYAPAASFVASETQPITGAGSLQRTVWLTGPNNVKRELHDGDSFTDCNYYKRYCYPYCLGRTDQERLQNAILVCDYDDGSTWIDGSGDVHAYGGKGHSLPTPVSVLLTAASPTLTIPSGSYANFVLMTNISPSSGAAFISLNGGQATVTLDSGVTMTFDKSEICITSITVTGISGGSEAVEVLYSVDSPAYT